MLLKNYHGNGRSVGQWIDSDARSANWVVLRAISAATSFWKARWDRDGSSVKTTKKKEEERKVEPSPQKPLKRWKSGVVWLVKCASVTNRSSGRGTRQTKHSQLLMLALTATYSWQAWQPVLVLLIGALWCCSKNNMTLPVSLSLFSLLLSLSLSVAERANLVFDLQCSVNRRGQNAS